MSTMHLPKLGTDPASPFPPVEEALLQPNGLLAWGGDLHPQRLLAAYRQGIFPWYTEGEPILWWSPAPRCVIFPSAFHTSRRTRRRFNSADYRVEADTAFEQVVHGCAAPRNGHTGTWITTELRLAFVELHRQGHAHSIEVWHENRLVGGVYGLALGKVFFGESMFSISTDASKIALTALCRQLADWQFAVFDCQVANSHLHSLGAVQISRPEFKACLHATAECVPLPGPWTKGLRVDERW